MEAELGKEKIKIPFNTYDLFGYLIPGATTLIAIYSFEFWANLQLTQPLTSGGTTKLHLPFLTAINAAGAPLLTAHDWVLSATFLISLLIISYVAGHIVSSISSFCLDRILVYKGYRYPYQLLLDIKIPEKSWDTGPFYRGLFFWINAYILLRYYSTFSPSDTLLLSLTGYLGWYIVITGIVKAAVSHFRLHPLSSLVSKTPAIVKKIGGTLLHHFLETLFAGGYDALTRFMSQYINTRTTFQAEFIECYKQAFRSNFGLDPETAETNNYWLSKCYVSQFSPSLDGMIDNWLHMYSYARNLSTAFYLVFVYCFLSIFWQIDGVQSLDDPVLFYLPLFFFCISLIMLGRYYYLYFTYYSKFIFRAFFFLTQPKVTGPRRVS